MCDRVFGCVVEVTDLGQRWSVERCDQVADRWPRVRCRWEGEVAKVAVAADDGVGAELSDVLGRSTKSAPAADELCIHADGARRPHLPVGASFGAEQSVDRPVGVGDDVEGEVEVLTVGGEAFACGEGDDADLGVTELVEVIAHGDHVLLARQSSKLPVQDQHVGPAAHLRGMPRPTLVIDELDVREPVTDVEAHAVSPVRADRRNQRRRFGDGRPHARTATARTRRTLGLTMCTSPTTTVGTVSFPFATDRTKAAASGSSQMLISRNASPDRRTPARWVKQYGHPGRVYKAISLRPDGESVSGEPD